MINECNNIYKKKRKYAISYEDKEMENYIATNDENENIEFESTRYLQKISKNYSKTVLYNIIMI